MRSAHLGQGSRRFRLSEKSARRNRHAMRLQREISRRGVEEFGGFCRDQLSNAFAFQSAAKDIPRPKVNDHSQKQQRRKCDGAVFLCPRHMTRNLIEARRTRARQLINQTVPLNCSARYPSKSGAFGLRKTCLIHASRSKDCRCKSQPQTDESAGVAAASSRKSLDRHKKTR